MVTVRHTYKIVGIIIGEVLMLTFGWETLSGISDGTFEDAKSDKSTLTEVIRGFEGSTVGKEH